MKTYTIKQIDEIVKLNDWSLCVCNHEPESHLDTIQVALEEDVDYFGQFVGNPDEDKYEFEFYTD